MAFYEISLPTASEVYGGKSLMQWPPIRPYPDP